VQAVCDYDYQQILIKATDDKKDSKEARFNYSMQVEVNNERDGDDADLRELNLELEKLMDRIELN